MKTCPVTLLLWNLDGAATRFPRWHLGETHTAEPTVDAGRQAVDRALTAGSPGSILFWDARLGIPNATLVSELLEEPADLWHAGLRVGTAGLPEEIDYLSPAWMLNRDPDPGSRVTSWRLSLRACLARTRVLSELGHLDPVFESLEAAALDMGYRYVWRGAVPLHEPRLIEGCPTPAPGALTLQDRYAFVARHYKDIWLRYVLLRRALGTRRIVRERRAYRQAVQKVRAVPRPYSPDAYLEPPDGEADGPAGQLVSVLIPTLCRYPYLQNTLEDLRRQSVRPLEVICVDQTPAPERRPDLYQQYSDLNLSVVWRDEPGQCSARNAGLAQVRGHLILFLDDDVGLRPDYLERLLDALRRYRADVAGGVWTQEHEEALAPADRYFRVSDRLATGNSLMRREALQRVGGFDLNYDRNYRADADLGMRLYLAGGVSVLTPHAKEHSHSPTTGGLSTFGMHSRRRKVKLLRPWPGETQVYYLLRYFSGRQLREALLLALISTAIPWEARYTRSTARKSAYVLASLWTLPFRLAGVWRSLHAARRMLRRGPQIPQVEFPRATP